MQLDLSKITFLSDPLSIETGLLTTEIQPRATSRYTLAVKMQSIGRNPTLILLGGLPGSGKSMYVESLRTKGYTVFDDFQKQSIGDLGSFFWSRHYSDLVRNLREGRQCIVADVRLVTVGYRDDTLRTLKAEIPDLVTEFRLFELNRLQCVQNINNSPEPPAASLRLETLREYLPQYSLPEGICPIPVWRSQTVS